MEGFFPPWVLFVLAGVVGAILGSFANVCIVRMPAEESIVRPRSHCPSCQHQLSWWENIPLVSYLILRGRCSSCQGRISWRYPAVEVLCSLLGIGAWWHFRHPLPFMIFYCLLLVPLVIVTLIDLQHYIIPDGITLPGIFVGVASRFLLAPDASIATVALITAGGAIAGGLLALLAEQAVHRLRRCPREWTPEVGVAGALVGILVANLAIGQPTPLLAAVADSAAGALTGGFSLFIVAFVYKKLTKNEGLGGGDVKLIAMLGAYFGWRAAIFMLFTSSVLGSLVGVALVIGLRKTMKYAMPFGPFLALAGVIQLFFGNSLIRWYLNFLR